MAATARSAARVRIALVPMALVLGLGLGCATDPKIPDTFGIEDGAAEESTPLGARRRRGRQRSSGCGVACSICPTAGSNTTSSPGISWPG